MGLVKVLMITISSRIFLARMNPISTLRPCFISERRWPFVLLFGVVFNYFPLSRGTSDLVDSSFPWTLASLISVWIFSASLEWIVISFSEVIQARNRTWVSMHWQWIFHNQATESPANNYSFYTKYNINKNHNICSVHLPKCPDYFKRAYRESITAGKLMVAE